MDGCSKLDYQTDGERMGFYDDIDSDVLDTGMWWGARTFVDAPIDFWGKNMNADSCAFRNTCRPGNRDWEGISWSLPQKSEEVLDTPLSWPPIPFDACKQIYTVYISSVTAPALHHAEIDLVFMQPQLMYIPSPRRNFTPKSIFP